MDDGLEIGAPRFALARAADRDARAAHRRAEQLQRRASLDAGRGAFLDAVKDSHGAATAEIDADLLEHIAEQLVACLERLEPSFERLDAARDRPSTVGGLVRWSRAHLDLARLAHAGAEAIADELLSPEAAAMLSAAVAVRAG